MYKFLVKSFLFFMLSSPLVSLGQTLTTDITDILIADDNFASLKRLMSDVDTRTKNKVFVWQVPDAVGAANKNIRCAVYTENMTLISDFIVNTTTAGDQLYPFVKINQTDESFIVTWASWIDNSNTNDPNKYDIYAKKIRFNNIAIDASSADFLVNTNFVTGRQSLSLITYDYVNNEAVIAWTDLDGQDRLPAAPSADNGCYARRINSSGNVLTLILGADQFLINLVTVSHQSICAIEISPVTGELYIVFQAIGYSSTTYYDIIFRKFTRGSGGNYTGGTESIVNTYQTNQQYTGYLTVNSITGNYAISWTSEVQDGSGRGAYVKIFDKYNNILKDETRIHQSATNNQLAPKGIWEEQSNILIYFYWYSDGSISNVRYQIFDGAYNYSGGEVAAESLNLQSYYAGAYYIGYDYLSKKLLLTFDQYNSSSGVVTKGWFRQLLFIPPPDLPTVSTSDMNYVETQTILESGKKQEYELQSLSETSLLSSRLYYDGLGREKQQVTKKGSPGKKDLVQPFEYDQYGRQVKSYLPYADIASDGAYKNNYTTDQASFYNNTSNSNADRIVNDANPFVIAVYENSPLNRIVQSFPQGNAWQTGLVDHSVKTSFKTNLINEVRKWDYNFTSQIASGSSFYSAGQLVVIETTDEDNNKSWVYKDKADRIVLQKRQETVTNIFLETYYIYDDLGNLRFVLPPQSVSLLSTISYQIGYTGAFSDSWFFTYKYDSRRRIIEKKIPGAGIVFYVYDNYDRPVLSQDANQRDYKRWSYIKYDAFNRAVMTGVYTHATVLDQASMQSLFTANNTTGLSEKRQASTSHGYSSIIWPIDPATSELLTVLYYDDYDFDYNNIADYSYSTQGLIEEASPLTKVRDRPTGTKAKILGTSADWLRTVIFYDDRNRPIQIQKDNHKNLTVLSDIETNVYDFSGKIINSKVTHNPGSAAVVVLNKYEYDHTGRLLTSKQKINSDAEVLLSKMTYNELGQSIEKNLHSENNGSSFLQSVDYTYTIRGWLKSINNSTLTNDAVLNNDANDLFGLELAYENSSATGNIGMYNGNISGVSWKGANTATSLTPKAYNYSYDGLNRLKEAAFGEYSSGAWNFSAKFGEKHIGYDLNSNITVLQRSDANSALLDDLSYTYEGNRLRQVIDAGNALEGFKDGVNISNEYDYDFNGNLTIDLNKGITLINYNQLNLPVLYQFGSASNRIEYTYSADGTKLIKKVYIAGTLNSTTDYTGKFNYINGVLSSIATTEGRAKPNGAVYLYEYDLKDNLGNVRISFDKNPSTGIARIIQEDHYYPFGLQLSSPLLRYRFGTENKILYNSKEKQDEHGLELYDYGARFYDQALGRWHVIDPLSEKGRRWSPYVYAFDNPIRFIDPDGRWPDMSIFSEIADFGNGVANAVGSNATTVAGVDGRVLTQVIERRTGNSSYSAGQSVGDVLSIVEGLVEGAIGVPMAGGGAVGGTISSPTVVGAGAGVVVTTAGIALTSHGVSTSKNGINNLLKSNGRVNSEGGNVIDNTKTNTPASSNNANPGNGGTKLLNQFNSSESLIQGAGKLQSVKGAMQGFVNGDGNAIFKAITNGGKISPKGYFTMPDGTIINKYFSSTTGEFTISINKGGQMFKIRVNP